MAKAERATRMEARIVEFEATVRRRAGWPAEIRQFDADHGANGCRRTADQSSAPGERGGRSRRRGNLGQCADGILGHRRNCPLRFRKSAARSSPSSEIARKAVDEAGQTDATMQGLAENASRISVVVDLIQVIASQTNLLAPQRHH